MNPSFNFSPLLQALLVKPILKQVQKAGTWATRQIDGKDKGDAVAAANKPIYDAVEGMAADSLAHAALSQVGASHIASDKLALALGIPTTEQGLAAKLGGGAATLDLSNPSAVLNLLSQSLVK